MGLSRTLRNYIWQNSVVSLIIRLYCQWINSLKILVTRAVPTVVLLVPKPTTWAQTSINCNVSR